MNRTLDSFVPHQFQRLPADEMTARARAFYELMDQRRTVRDFSDDPIPEGVIEQAVLTAGTAPSGAHKQPWLFCVVRDAEVKARIREAAEKEERDNYSRRYSEEWLEDLAPFGTDADKAYIDEAPALIVVFKRNYEIIDGERHKNYYVNESIGIAAGMLIAALHNAGLVTLTHTPSPMGFFNEILNRPKNETPILLLPVGYPKTGARIPNLARKPLDEIMIDF